MQVGKILMTEIKKSQDLAIKIGELIDGQNSEVVKLALLGIWDLIHELEKE